MLRVYTRPGYLGRIRRYEPVEFNGGRRLPIDLHVDNDEFVLSAEVAGMAPEDLTVEIHDGVLTLKGEIKAEPNGEGKYLLRERTYGDFCRSFRLPEAVDVEKVEAKIENGILRVRLPKAEEAKPKSIQIKSK